MAETGKTWCSEDFSITQCWRWQARAADDELKQSGQYTDYSSRERDALLMALPRFLLECYSEHIRHTRGRSWAPLEGSKAVELVAIEKYGWLPEDVRGLKEDELILALHAELADCQFPREVYDAVSPWFDRYGMHDHIRHLSLDAED